MFYVSLETDFILALEMGEDFALSAIDAMSGGRGFPLIVPSVIQELTWMSKNHPEESFKGVAEKALRNLANHHILSPSLDSTMLAVAEITAKRLVNAGVYECLQSATVIAESALLNCRVLLTYEPRTASLEQLPALKLHLLAAGVADCMPMPPHVFVKYFTQPANRPA